MSNLQEALSWLESTIPNTMFGDISITVVKRDGKIQFIETSLIHKFKPDQEKNKKPIKNAFSQRNAG